MVGDGQFTPEQMLGYEFGYRNYFRKTGFLNISTFFNRYADLLSVESRAAIVEPSPEPAHLVLPLYLRNGVKADTAGVEVGHPLGCPRVVAAARQLFLLASNAKNRQ